MVEDQGSAKLTPAIKNIEERSRRKGIGLLPEECLFGHLFLGPSVGFRSCQAQLNRNFNRAGRLGDLRG